MLNSCAAGVTVVNIDNGFGAAAAASRICAHDGPHPAGAARPATSSGSTWCIPRAEELTEIAERYGLHAVAVNDCLDPEHLPKFEAFESHTFIILRACDETRRAVRRHGAGPDPQDRDLLLAPIPHHHPSEGPGLAQRHSMSGRRPSGASRPRNGFPALLCAVCNAALRHLSRAHGGDREPARRFRDQGCSAGSVVSSTRSASELHEIHILKHQVTVYKRLLWRTSDVVQRIVPGAGRAATLFRDVQENAESYHFYADELLDDANTLLNVQLALASHRTGEVMRVLTVFSVFFLPLTFIVGVYGMNFHFMPELRRPGGTRPCSGRCCW